MNRNERSCHKIKYCGSLLLFRDISQLLTIITTCCVFQQYDEFCQQGLITR